MFNGLKIIRGSWLMVKLRINGLSSAVFGSLDIISIIA